MLGSRPLFGNVLAKYDILYRIPIFILVGNSVHFEFRLELKGVFLKLIDCFDDC